MHPVFCLLAAMCVFLAGSWAAAAQPRLPIDTDFGQASHDVRQAGGSERTSGMLPERWNDNSDWAQVWVNYRPMEQEGRKYLSVEVTQCQSGRCQFVHPLPNITDETFCRLTMRARIAAGTGVDFHVREMGAPYRVLWTSNGGLSADWRTVTLDFRLERFAGPVGLFIALNDVGRLDISDLRLEQRSRDELIAEMRTSAATGPKNLMRLSRFPLGLQNGFALWREKSDGDEIQAQADPKVIGPSGSPALRLWGQGGQGGQEFQLYLAPFAMPAPVDPHTASIYVRGTGNGHLRVIADRKWLVDKPFTLTSPEQWQRVEVTFTPLLLAKAHILAIAGSGELWIDAAQVEAGQKATAYAPQMPYEVALAVDSPARVQFVEDEPALVRFCVSGQGSGKTLKARVHNAYGEQAVMPDVPLDGQRDLQQGELRFDRFASRPLGSFRIEAWVEDDQGRRVSSFNELVVHRLRRPRYWGKDAPDSPFGVHTLSTNRHLLMAKAAGVNWVRLHDAGLSYIGWKYLEPEKGKWTFHDTELKRYRDHHIKILGLLSTAPQWASYMKGPHDGYFDQFYQPKDLNDFANYVKVVTTRYKGMIDAYDVWNEPWNIEWWAVDYDESKTDRSGYLTSKDPTGDFARLTRTAWQAAKAVDPSLTIAGVNSTTELVGRNWSSGIVAHDGVDPCDVIAYHQYYSAMAGYPGDLVESGFQSAMGPILAKFGSLPKPVWMTEGSSVSNLIGNGLYEHTLAQPEREDVLATSDRMSRQLVSLLAQGVRRIFLYSMHAHDYMGAGSEWRVLVNEDGYLHPSATAHSALAWQLEDTRFAGRVAVAADVYAFLFEGNGRAVAVLARKPGAGATYALPGGDGVERTDLFGNPLDEGAALGPTVAYVTIRGTVADLKGQLSAK